jgi:hypothetical protein
MLLKHSVRHKDVKRMEHDRQTQLKTKIRNVPEKIKREGKEKCTYV